MSNSGVFWCGEHERGDGRGEEVDLDPANLVRLRVFAIKKKLRGICPKYL